MVAMQWKSVIWKWFEPIVVKGCIYYSHKIKEISKGTIITLDLQLRYPVVCVVVVNQMYFPEGIRVQRLEKFPGGHFNFFCLSEMNSAEERKREKGRQGT